MKLLSKNSGLGLWIARVFVILLAVLTISLSVVVWWNTLAPADWRWMEPGAGLVIFTGVLDICSAIWCGFWIGIND